MARETRFHSEVESYQRLKKMVLDTSLLNTQHYKVRIKGKVDQSREWSSSLPTPRCSCYWKGSLRVALDYGGQLYLLCFANIYVWVKCICSCYWNFSSGSEGCNSYKKICVNNNIVVEFKTIKWWLIECVLERKEGHLSLQKNKPKVSRVDTE